jgi:hypothetical protein
MIRRREKDKQRFQVSCIWCGSKYGGQRTRFDGRLSEMFLPNSRNHLRSQKRTGYGEFVSESLSHLSSVDIIGTFRWLKSTLDLSLVIATGLTR